MGLLSVLFGRRPKFSALESQILGAVSLELPPAAREVFDKQIELINSVQRLADGKEVSLYLIRRGKSCFEEQFRFPLRSETALAAVEVEAACAKEEMGAEVWLVNGRVFSIEFNKPPKVILAEGGSVGKATILCDPMVAGPKDSTFEPRRREEVLATIRSRLPDEYLRLVGEGKAVMVNEWSVSEIQNIRKIVQRDANYYVVAEKVDMGAVGVKEDESSGQPYYLDYGGGRGEKITVSLQKFFEDFDGGKVLGRF